MATNIIPNLAGGLGEIGQLAGGAGQGLMGGLGQLGQGLLGGVGQAGQGLLGGVGQLGQAGQGLLGNVGQAGQGLLGGVGQAGQGLLGGVGQAGQGLLGNIGQAGQGLLGGVGQAGQGLLGGVGQAGQSLFGGLAGIPRVAEDGGALGGANQVIGQPQPQLADLAVDNVGGYNYGAGYGMNYREAEAGGGILGAAGNAGVPIQVHAPQLAELGQPTFVNYKGAVEDTNTTPNTTNRVAEGGGGGFGNLGGILGDLGYGGGGVGGGYGGVGGGGGGGYGGVGGIGGGGYGGIGGGGPQLAELGQPSPINNITGFNNLGGLGGVGGVGQAIPSSYMPQLAELGPAGSTNYFRAVEDINNPTLNQNLTSNQNIYDPNNSQYIEDINGGVVDNSQDLDLNAAKPVRVDTKNHCICLFVSPPYANVSAITIQKISPDPNTITLIASDCLIDDSDFIVFGVPKGTDIEDGNATQVTIKPDGRNWTIASSS